MLIYEIDLIKNPQPLGESGKSPRLNLTHITKMENANVSLRVHKVHRKNNGAHTVGMVIERVMADGMKLTKYASVKYTKKPLVGTIIKCTNVVTETNKQGFDWITAVE